MEKIIVIGAGGHAAEIDDYFHHARQASASFGFALEGYLDDNAAGYEAYRFSAPFLGTIKDHIVRRDCSYIMGIANLKYRKPIIQQFADAGARFITFIHPTATISPSASVGQGVLIAPYVNLGPNTTVGDFTVINSRCSLGHDTRVGNFNFISPNVCFSGFTKVGDENLFGINSATIPGIQVGNRNKIMAGMVLDKNVGDEETVFFRFKEKIMAVPK